MSRRCAIEVYDRSSGLRLGWFSHFDVMGEDGRVKFKNLDRNGMDWIGDVPVLRSMVLEHKISGRVSFAFISPQGDLQLWGYDFDGMGGITLLKGEVGFQAAPVPNTLTA